MGEEIEWLLLFYYLCVQWGYNYGDVLKEAVCLEELIDKIDNLQMQESGNKRSNQKLHA